MTAAIGLRADFDGAPLRKLARRIVALAEIYHGDIPVEPPGCRARPTLLGIRMFHVKPVV